jgi:hypothetical protein
MVSNHKVRWWNDLQCNNVHIEVHESLFVGFIVIGEGRNMHRYDDAEFGVLLSHPTGIKIYVQI